MSRIVTAAVIAALALPVLALAALIGEQERLTANSRILTVPLRGYDPRDLLQGHYVFAQLDLDWEREPKAPNDYDQVEGGACILAETPKPRVRFLPDWKPGNRADDECRMVIAGRAWPRQGATAPQFVPTSLDGGGGGMRFYVSEWRGPELEHVMRDRPGAFTADLAVRADGNVSIRTLRVDGQAIGR